MQSAAATGRGLLSGEAADARRLLAHRLEPLLGQLEVGEPGRQADPQTERVHDLDRVAARLAERARPAPRAPARGRDG